MHVEAYRFIQSALGSLTPRRSVLEIGSRNINGSVRSLFNGAAYVGIDVTDGPGVDLVENGATFTTECRVDTVVCCEVLEHTEEAPAIVANAISLLQPDGILLVTCAAPPRAPHSAVDGNGLRNGEYYRNVAPNELHAWVLAAGGEIVMLAHDPERGDLYLCARKGLD
jgi:SAM-dependent methyltransferase